MKSPLSSTATLILITSLASGFAPATAQAQSRGGWGGLSTGTKVAIVGGAALGGYLLYRSYERSQERQQEQRQQLYRDSDYSRGYSSSDSDSGYTSYRERLTPAEQAEITRREYDHYRKTNQARFEAAKKTMIAQVQTLQRTANPAYICASVCGGWQEYSLSVSPQVYGGATPDQAMSQLNGACGKGSMLFDGLADNRSGTATISLKARENVCFPNRFDTKTEIPAAQGSQKIRLSLNDLTILEDGTPVTPGFKRSTVRELGDVLKLVNGMSTLGAVKDKVVEMGGADLESLLAQIKLVKVDPQKGTVLYANDSKNPRERVTALLKRSGAAIIDETAELPWEFEHACGKEFHRVRIQMRAVIGGAPAPASVASDSLLNLTMEALDAPSNDPTGAEDPFCAGRPSGSAVSGSASEAPAAGAAR